MCCVQGYCLTADTKDGKRQYAFYVEYEPQHGETTVSSERMTFDEVTNGLIWYKEHYKLLTREGVKMIVPTKHE